MGRETDVYLVTGACGFVGSHLVDALVSKGFFVRATDLRKTNQRYLPSSDALEFLPADLTKPLEVQSIISGVTKVFHPAGIFHFSVPEEILFKVNVDGTTNLLSAALSENISHFVNWSTAMVYGTLQHTPADESHPIQPEDPYSKSKWAQEEKALSYFEENGLFVSTIRPTAIYGPRSFYGTAKAILALIKGDLFALPAGSGKVIQHHVHVEDVVRAAIFICDNAKTAGEAYNIADDMPISIEDSFNVVTKLVNKKPPRLRVPKWSVYLYGHLDRTWNRIRGKESLFEKTALKLLFSDHVFDNSKLKRLGFEYSVPDFKTGIKPTLQWYKQLGYIK
jgi:dTDP-glucose 4,6-dehydratase